VQGVVQRVEGIELGVQVKRAGFGRRYRRRFQDKQRDHFIIGSQRKSRLSQ